MRPSSPLDQVIAEALQMWLEKQHKKHAVRDKALLILRRAGIVMEAERQQTLAETVIAVLPCKDKVPLQTEVEAALSKVKVPLSEEIIATRKEQSL